MSKLLTTSVVIAVASMQIAVAQDQEMVDSSSSVAIADRDAQPTKPPNSAELVNAIFKYNLDGTCEVKMDVDEEGVPFNVEPDCSPAVYNKAAIRAIKTARFAPKFKAGKPTTREGVIYSFKLNKSLGPVRDRPPCLKQNSSNTEKKRLRIYGEAIIIGDEERAQKVLAKLNKASLYCKQEARFMLFKARHSALKGDFERAEAQLDELHVFLNNGYSVTAYVSAMHETMRQWVDFNLKAEAGQITGDHPAKLLNGMCMQKVKQAYKGRGKEESCSVIVEVDETGAPRNPQSDCEREAYADAARKAASCTIHLPRIEKGERVAGPAVRFSTEFKTRG